MIKSVKIEYNYVLFLNTLKGGIIMKDIKKIRIGICGYGNLGKGVENEIRNNTDMELVAIFSRRDLKDICTTGDVPIVSMNDLFLWKDKIDVMILCGGSAKDLPVQGPSLANLFNTVDSFDTHADILKYYKAMNEVANESNHTSIISVGWDPGLFSLNRLIDQSILPNGNTYTFWGKGVSQGHSNAVRRIEGVKNAIQYTIPIEESIDKVRKGENPNLSEKQKHIRECFVVLEEGGEKNKIEQEIKNMPNYFSDYETIVNFITEEEFILTHNKMPHGGFVIHSGNTSENKQIMEFSLKLDSNPEFTSCVLLAYSRACYKLSRLGEYGAKTVFDIPPFMLSKKTKEELIGDLL